MLVCQCLYWNRVRDATQTEPDYFSLPDPIPHWPEGTGFATSRINLGELEVCQITKFEFIWGTDGEKGVSFYKPISIPEGFSCLGHYCQSKERPLHGFVLVAREFNTQRHSLAHNSYHKPPLANPIDYSLIWISDNDGDDDNFDSCGYFWLPQPPEGYKALGFVVTNKSEKPNPDEVKCVRADLTDTCEIYRPVVDVYSKFSKLPLRVWKTRPLHRGMFGRGVFVGTFYCGDCSSSRDELDIACLKNIDTNLHAMPNLDQIHALIVHYGPTVFFHPDETYLPSSVSWFFENGAVLYDKSSSVERAIDSEGSNLPAGGTNDGAYWIDLPGDTERACFIKRGNLESAKLYVHVKPALGGTFTDIAMWVFCPFNGPGTLKIGMMNIALSKIGRHVGDWEHFTLRVSNFSSMLWAVYFSQHSGGKWVGAHDLEFLDGNKFAVYSSRNGHASFPHPGDYIQGSAKLGIGVRNDVERSGYRVDSSRRYEIVAAEYLGEGVVNGPGWLDYMRKWGPTVVYDSRAELDRIIKVFPTVVRCSLQSILNKLPLELYGEDGPTGPKEKNNWVGDERW
ncbi:Plant protein of unknown function (DUF946 [Striga hermonthica]|uniref:Vacuolar protein sorting-associated protein 62 n=1 Tax=Striga hermonthica TaxID=68872 RepID=A0A9N7N6R3_STRHE|nr:Plant protein of unknown function (DUF946 [Striga hermonthica]